MPAHTHTRHCHRRSLPSSINLSAFWYLGSRTRTRFLDRRLNEGATSNSSHFPPRLHCSRFVSVFGSALSPSSPSLPFEPFEWMISCIASLKMENMWPRSDDDDARSAISEFSHQIINYLSHSDFSIVLNTTFLSIRFFSFFSSRCHPIYSLWFCVGLCWCRRRHLRRAIHVRVSCLLVCLASAQLPPAARSLFWAVMSTFVSLIFCSEEFTFSLSLFRSISRPLL